MELINFLTALAAFLPVVYGAPADSASQLHPEILAAMKRDLGLSAEQAHARITREIAAVDVIENLSLLAGEAFAGAWLVDGEVNVAVTDETLVADITAAGATPLVFDTPLTKLEQAMAAIDALDIEAATLDDSASASASGIATYFIDVEANKLVLEATEAGASKAATLATDVGLTETEFEVRVVTAIPTVLATVRGGDAYLIERTSRCSVGFSVTTGFVSAGHCGTAGDATTTSGGVALGSFSGSVFPGSDYAFIRGSSGNTFTSSITGSSLPVAGSTVSAVGSSICRSGSTSGVYCGTVRALSATVNYAEGRVTGLTQTNVCGEPGDSGGSFYTGAQAQGVLSGGSGDCTRGGTTYFNPLGEILTAYGLTLVTG